MPADFIRDATTVLVLWFVATVIYSAVKRQSIGQTVKGFKEFMEDILGDTEDKVKK